MNIEHSLNVFSEKYGIDISDLFAKGKLIIKADDHIELECIKANGYIYISAVVVELSNNYQQRTNILKDALKANFALIETERYILSIDKQHSQLLLTLAQEQQEIELENFEQMITDVLNNTEFFKTYLSKIKSKKISPFNYIMP